MKHGFLYSDGKDGVLADVNDPGLLIAFEGLDGSGKTTQRKLLKSCLQAMPEDVVVTKWNSAPSFKSIIKKRKAERSLDPASYAVLHAADFWHRYETNILPALAQGKIVLADRYVFTGVARDVARGMDPAWCRGLYAGVRKPDIVLYFKADISTCATRIAASREIKFYEAGQDVTGLDDPYESYLQFASRVTAEYERLHKQFRFVIIDAEQPIYDQHRLIRDTCLQHFRQKPTQPAYRHPLNPVFSQVDV